MLWEGRRSERKQEPKKKSVMSFWVNRANIKKAHAKDFASPKTLTIDFSDRLNRRKKAMYRTFVRRPNLESSEYEILPKEMILQETPIQKLRRLMYEVKELGQEAELNEKVHTRTPPITLCGYWKHAKNTIQKIGEARLTI